MALKLIANYSKRPGLPGYSSHQFPVCVETEITNPDDIAGESARLYRTLQESVDEEIQQTGFVPEQGYGSESTPRTNGSRSTNGSVTNGSTNYKDSPPGISFMGKKTWHPGKNFGKFIAATFGIPPREQTASVEKISDAVSDTATQVREAMKEHRDFRDLGKHLLKTWEEGISSLRDKHTYALGGWSPGKGFQGLSDPSKPKVKRRIVGKS